MLKSTALRVAMNTLYKTIQSICS